MYVCDLQLTALIPGLNCRQSCWHASSLVGGRRSSLPAAGILGLLLWTTALWFQSAASMAETVSSQSQNRFQRTVQYLQTAAPELRGEFAAIALTHLANAYVDEAKLARTEARASGRNANLGGWSAMVDYYARQMPLLLADIELGLPVQLTLGGEQSLAITVADRIVIVSPPRLTQQNAFEQKILVDFCQQHSCEGIVPETAQPQPLAARPVAIRPQWTFSAQGPVCAYQGITVHFQSEKNLSNSRLICVQFLREVIALTDELASQQRHGVVIDWEILQIQATAHSPEHTIAVNSQGDSLLVTVPLLYRSAALLQRVLPWIKAWVMSQQGARIDLNADDYGWQQP
jgi:hypothetical protein